MSRWVTCLRTDSVAWDNFKEWVTQHAYSELKKLRDVDKEGHDYQRGVIAGWESVLAEATAAEREERAKHEYGRRNRAN